jgi:predicted outer membrane repeat protein
MQLKDSTISGNHAADGGGVYVWIGRFETITDTDIAGNVAHDGGGLFNTLLLNDQTLSGTKFVNNRAGNDGGGIYNDNDDNDPNWNAANMQIIGNIAGSAGGGIFNNGPAAAILTTSLVNANKPTNCAPAGSVAGCSG